ncbi:MAG: hypothetical protein Q7J02_00880 [Rhodocyclaceae bacterium]|nr:hypothetical protein [Rhodocyclaceae bacterium]
MAALFLALAGAAHAQLADPTRPPAALGGVGDPAGAAVFEFSGLQSVILRKGGKPAALINGSVVELGGKVGEARLIRVNEDSVVLRGPQGDETLRLIPAAEKKVSRVGVPPNAVSEKANARKAGVMPEPKVGAGAVANPAAQKPAQQAAQNRKTDK